MSLVCVNDNVVKPVMSFAFDTVKDYVSYIRSYDDNITTLKQNLKNLCSKKLDINRKVNAGKDNLEIITKKAANWLQSVRKLTQNEELMKLVQCEHKIAEEVLKLMEEKDLKKLLKEDNEMQGVVLKVMKENSNEQDLEVVNRVVLEVMKDTTDEFKRVLKEDMDLAMVATKLLEDEELDKLSVGDTDLAYVLMKAREMCEKKSWEITDNEEADVKLGKLVSPLQKLTNNENLMNALPEHVKLGVQMMDGLVKGSKGLKDEFQTGKHKDGKPCCKYVVVPFRHFNHRYKMSKRAEKLAKDVQSMIDSTPPLDSVSVPGRTSDLKGIPSEFVKGLESRDEFLRMILKKLQDDQVDVGVYGMGGSGKTTLAKEIVNSKAKSNFDTILMVEISESPNIKRIQDELAEALDLNLHDVHSLSQRAIKLYNRLKRGKEEGNERKKDGKGNILIILDNMWHKLNLSEVGIPCETTNDFCCKFLVISREKRVCQLMGIKDDNIFQLGFLNDNESKELFYQHVGHRIHEEHYESVAQRLLKKSGGLPLTIGAMANTLKGKDFSIWQRFADELEKPILSQLSNVHHETYAILETSYKFMENEYKKIFFLNVCLSPLGSSISIENLMRYGIGLDLFQHVNKLSEAMEQASTWVKELISSSLLLEGDSEGHVKIHDDVRASAISFASKDEHKFLVGDISRWMSKERFNTYTAISLSSNHHFSRLKGAKAEMLQILVLEGNLSELHDECFFNGMSNLKVLHLSYIKFEKGMPKSIAKLMNLKTLQLERCRLGDISLIGDLEELLVLSLRDSFLEEFPASIGKLVNLRMLDMGGRCRVHSLANTNVLATLTSLEGLYLFDNFKDWTITPTQSNDIAEFHKLSHLNLLEVHVYNPEHLPIGQFAKNLDFFNISVSWDDKVIDLKKIMIRPLHRVLSLQNIDLNNARYEALLKRADCLRLDCTTLGNNGVPTKLYTQGFRDLKYLEISECSGMECVINTNGLNDLLAFQNLEYLNLKFCSTLKMICKGEAPPGMFSNLRILVLRCLDKLQHVLPLPLQPCALTKIEIIWCESLEFIFNENGEHKEKDIVIELPCLKSVDIEKCPKIISVLGPATKLSTNSNDGIVGQAFFNEKIICPSLEKLRLVQCGSIEKLWNNKLEISSFRNLKVIYIRDCLRMQSLGSPCAFSTLVGLESLTINYCLSSDLQGVITKETEECDIPENIIKFPKLKYLELFGLEGLKSFYGGCYKLEFPKLKIMKLSQLPGLTTFVTSEDSKTLFSEKVELPSLEELEMFRVIKDTHTSVMKDGPMLRKLTIDSIKGLKLIPSTVSQNISSLHLYDDFEEDCRKRVLFSTPESSSANEEPLSINYSQLPKLQQLCVSYFKFMEKLFEDNDTDTSAAAISTLCRQLRQLELSWLPKLELIPLDSFKNLRSFSIMGLKWKYVFPNENVVMRLEKLEDLEIRLCYHMEVVIKDEQEGMNRDITFPCLNTLKLQDTSICNFSSSPDASIHFPSLETLHISDCENLQVFWSGPLVAPKLKDVYLSECSEMQWFISGNSSQVVELSSLQCVQIKSYLTSSSLKSSCSLKSFSTRPLKAPKLIELSLEIEGDMQWFLPGNSNDINGDQVLELPSLEILHIGHRSDRFRRSFDLDLRSFSPTPLIAPKLTKVTVNRKDYSKQEFDDLNHFLQRRYVTRPELETTMSPMQDSRSWR